jgi:pyruvate,orthophosphate dikinase
LDQTLQLLQVLRIKGRATPDTLTSAVEADVAPLIEHCSQAGLIETAKVGFRITELGRQRVEELYAEERQRAESVILDVYETFLPINDEVKQIVSDWQMRVVDGQIVLNDHQDRAHDESVIARLCDVDAKVEPPLRSLCAALPRFELYPRRLGRALAKVRDGDHSMVAAPIKDSYHTVWFELHEDLLLLAGKERTE